MISIYSTLSNFRKQEENSVTISDRAQYIKNNLHKGAEHFADF